jgi:hypothetical protein
MPDGNQSHCGRAGVGAGGGGFKEYVEAAASIESYPAIEPWLGQMALGPERTIPEPEYTLKPSETLSSISHGCLGFWLEQAIEFLPGDSPAF